MIFASAQDESPGPFLFGDWAIEIKRKVSRLERRSVSALSLEMTEREPARSLRNENFARTGMSAPHNRPRHTTNHYFRAKMALTWAVTVMVCGVNCSVGGGAAFGAAPNFAKVIRWPGPGSKLSTEACRRSPRVRLEGRRAMTSAVARAL